jgi:hypothetical protein
VVPANSGYLTWVNSWALERNLKSMNGPLMRGAIGCAIACGAVVVGPSIAGIAVANADLLGIGGPDINVLGVSVLGSGPKSGSATRRVPSLAAVSTAPSAQSVVIRAKPPAAQAEPEISSATFDSAADAPAVAMAAPIVESVPAAPELPAAVPFVAPLPAAPVIDGPAPRAVPVPSTAEPGPGRQMAPAHRFSPPEKIPESFRVGYAEYLRSATMSDLFVAALPGVAGLAGFTMVGAFAGYRQARAVQAALLAPVPTRILL